MRNQLLVDTLADYEPVVMRLQKAQVVQAITYSRAQKTGYYSQRDNQTNPQTKRAQLLMGKLGEFGAYNFLCDVVGLRGCTPPDCKIYSVGEKSFDFDLKSPKLNFHVKACSPYDGPYHRSWVFERVDQKVFRESPPIEANEYLVLTTADPSKPLTVSVYGVVQILFLHTHGLFAEVRKPSLKETKLAVYWKDVVGVWAERERQEREEDKKH